MQQVIYLEVDDDMAAIRHLLEGAQAKQVLLVVPKGCHALRDALNQLLAAGQRIDYRSHIRILRFEPGPGFRAFLILQPAVRVDDLYAVQRVDHLVDFCRRRRGKRLRPPRRTCDDCRNQHRTQTGAAAATTPPGIRGLVLHFPYSSLIVPDFPIPTR